MSRKMMYLTDVRSSPANRRAHGCRASMLGVVSCFTVSCICGCYVPLPHWADIGVRKPSTWLEKTKFLELDRPIARLSFGAFDGRPGSELAILQGVRNQPGPAVDITFVDLSGNITARKRIHPENRERLDSATIIDVDGDGTCEFLVGAGRLVDHNGKLMASFYTPHSPAFSPSYRYVDYDRDGTLDFYTSHGLSFKVVDRFGRTLDEWPLETYSDRGQMRQIFLYDARLLDFDGDGLCDRVYTTRRERSYVPYEYELRVRSGDGKVSRTMPLPGHGWAVSPFPGHPGRRFLLQYVEQQLLVLPIDGSAPVARLENDAIGLSRLIAEVARFRPDEESLVLANHLMYQGRLVGYSDFRLFLRLFDDHGGLVYSEVLNSTYGSVERFVAIAPAGGDEMAALLVAEGPIVWRYGARRTESKGPNPASSTESVDQIWGDTRGSRMD